MQPSDPLACSSQRVVERARPEVVTDSLRLAHEAHYRPLLRLCVLGTGRRETAEDLVQEAFVRVAGRLDGLGDEEIRPYLRAAALNLWKKRLRRLALASGSTRSTFRVGRLRTNCSSPTLALAQCGSCHTHG